MINILLDCTKLKDMELMYNIGIGLKYFLIGILILIPFITLLKVLFNFFSKIRSRRTIKKFFIQTCLSIGLIFSVYLTPKFFSRVDEYKSSFDYCMKYTNKTNLNKLKENDKEKQLLKETGIEEKYNNLELMIKESKKDLITKINNQDKNNNEKRNMTIEIEEKKGQWGNLKFEGGIFYILGSNEKINKRDGLLGLNPVFLNRLNKMIEDSKEYNHKINVVIGYRPYSKYLETFNKDECNESCSYNLHPSVQMHSYGISSKLYFSTEEAKKWAYDNAYKYGLYFKYDSIIEPSKVVYNDYPTCNSLCEVEE